MIKCKEFVLNCNYYNKDTIDDMINKFTNERNIEIIDVKYASGCLSGTSEMYIRALVLYKEK